MNASRRNGVLLAGLLVGGCGAPAGGGAAGAAPVLLVVLFATAVSVSTTLALVHLLLFAFERRHRLNLYFALVAALFAAVATIGLLERLLGGPLVVPPFGELQRFAVSAVILATARFVYALFLARAPRRFWVYLGAISLFLVLGTFRPAWFELPAWLLGLLVIADLLQLMVRRWRALEAGAWVVAAGAGLFALGGGLQITLDLVDSGPLAATQAPYLWGGLLMLVSISVYLARSFAGVRRELERRLEEVETLSRLRLEQERSAREEEVRRRLLEADNRRKTEELEEARRLQIALLPAGMPEVPGFEVAAYMQTATEVGGDFYDFYVGPEGGLTVAVADAVGHGARAGTLVAAVKGLFQLAGGDGSLEERLHRFSAAIRGMGLPRAHVALALASFRAGGFEVASAGMPPALVRRAATGEVEEVMAEGVPLGGPAGFGYESREVRLARGDVVLLLSDGLPELPVGGGADGGAPLGYPGASALLAAAPAGSARELVAGIAAAARERAAAWPPPDDLTLVAVRVR